MGRILHPNLAFDLLEPPNGLVKRASIWINPSDSVKTIGSGAKALSVPASTTFSTIYSRTSAKGAVSLCLLAAYGAASVQNIGGLRITLDGRTLVNFDSTPYPSPAGNGLVIYGIGGTVASFDGQSGVYLYYPVEGYPVKYNESLLVEAFAVNGGDVAFKELRY